MADEKPKRKRWWLWLVLALVVVATVTTGTSSLGGREYAFLNRYHPGVEPWRSPLVAAAPAQNYKGSLYIFRKEDVKGVAEAMDRELMSTRGYRRLVGDNDERMISYDRSVGTESYGAVIVKPASVFAPMMLSKEQRATIPSGGCAVIVIREPTWLERQLDAVKKFLHWD